MRVSRRSLLKSMMLGLPGAVGVVVRSSAQDPNPAFDQLAVRPRGLPQLSPDGTWGEVINATTRWVVIQNQSRQQFPIRVDDLGRFLVRWPITLDRLTAQSVVEALGVDTGSSVLQTGHVDVFEGGDRTLVSPTVNSVFPNNGLMSAIDPNAALWLGGYGSTGLNAMNGYWYPFAPGMDGSPTLRHVVGTVASRVPFQVSVPGNNIVTIVPAPDGQFTMSQVTRGVVSYVRKGDYAFVMPVDITPKGLVLSQFVLYKNTPFREFNAALR